MLAEQRVQWLYAMDRCPHKLPIKVCRKVLELISNPQACARLLQTYNTTVYNWDNPGFAGVGIFRDDSWQQRTLAKTVELLMHNHWRSTKPLAETDYQGRPWYPGTKRTGQLTWGGDGPCYVCYDHHQYAGLCAPFTNDQLLHAGVRRFLVLQRDYPETRQDYAIRLDCAKCACSDCDRRSSDCFGHLYVELPYPHLPRGHHYLIGSVGSLLKWWCGDCFAAGQKKLRETMRADTTGACKRRRVE
jgi:hypothetical protein